MSMVLRIRRRGAATAGLMSALAGALAAPAVLSVAPASVEAQQASRWARAERGWIGVSFEVSGDRLGRVEAIVITEVNEDSPARRAGLRPGDRVLAINDLRRPEELMALPELLRLDAGDPVTMIVERDGERRRFRLTAAPRPADFMPGRRVEIAMAADSLVETWARSMDSLRVQLVTGDDARNIRIRSVVGGESRSTIVEPASGPLARPRFEFFVFRGEDHDSLRLEMDEVSGLVADLESRIQARERELRTRLGRRSDPELRQLRAELDRASTRSTELESAMAEAARSRAAWESGARADARDPWAGERAGGEYRPLTPYLLGRNRVAGAEVVDLRPELARYFDVATGVLVVDVAPGTPAAISGIVPGDVITRIDQVSVRTVEDLRYGVSVAGAALPLTLVRDGQSRQVLLRK